MGQIRASKEQKKQHRWRTGDACSTNPKSRKFRDEAKQNIISYQKKTKTAGFSGLTALALEKHDEKLADSDDGDEFQIDEDACDKSQSYSKSSIASSISGLTDCSNITFQNVQKLWASPLEEHKQICAVLAAVTEVIRSKDGKETETEYFATLITALQAANDEDSQTAIIFLLGLVIKRVPSNVLRARFSEASKIVFDLLSEHHQNGKTAMLKHLVSCLSTLLMIQEPSIWTHSSTMQMYHCVLNFTLHSKPKVRKTAHMAIKSLLKTNLVNYENHPAGNAACQFCIRSLEGQSSELSTSTLHILNLLKTILRYMGSENIRAICESIMRVMKLGNVAVKTNCFQTLHNLFDSFPPETNLPASLNGKIISALYDFQPSSNDVNLTPAWLKVMESAHANLSVIDSERCLASLPKLFASAMVYILSDSKDVANAAAETMKASIEKCLLPIADMIPVDSGEMLENLLHIFRHVEQGLKYKYQSVWNLILQMLALFFQVFGKSCCSLMTKCVITLCDLHSSRKFPFLSDLEKTIGAAIRSMGPRSILEAVPFNFSRLEEKCEFSRAWMLPLMRDYVQATELQFFIDYFLPLAEQLYEKVAAFVQNGKVLEAKIYKTLYQQIWSLLPSFCDNPIDLKESFKNIARILGKALTENEDLQLYILQSLRFLISKTQSAENLAEIGKYSKNYLPILFNLYTSKAEKDDKSSLLSILETIKAYLTLAERELVLSLLANASKKLDDSDIVLEKRLAVMDLIAAMATHVDEGSVEDIYKLTLPLISNEDMKVQKKAYRIMEEICGGNSDGCRQFVLANLEAVSSNLLRSVSTAAPSAKAPRLRCLTGILRNLSSEQKDFLISILPEVILCTKAINIKAKSVAFNLLEEIGNAYIRFESLPKEDCVMQYFQLIMAGMAGSPHMISATLLAVTKLARVYKDFVSSGLVETLLVAGVNLLQSKEREIKRAALGFIKAVMSILDRDELERHAQALIQNLFAGRRGDKNFLRTQTQFVLEKLIRKLGYETIRAFVPEDIKKFILNIHKGVEKRKKMKNSSFEERKEKRRESQSNSKTFQDTFDDLSSEDDQKEIADNEKSERWILEEAGEVVDLLDSKVSKNITGSKPSKKARTDGASSGFAFASDGKLIINSDINATKVTIAASDCPESLADKLGANGNKSSKVVAGKRLRSAVVDEDSGYQPGGSGIHRPLSKKSRQLDEDGGRQSFGVEYKAKKAGGDVKIRGKPDPFAYIPLKLQNLNKRKRAKMAGQFRGVVKAARQGSMKLKIKKTTNKKK